MSNDKDTVQKYVSDLISLDQHILEAIEGQLKHDETRQYTEANQFLNKLQGTMKGNITALEQQLSMIGGDSGGPVKKTVAAIAGVAASVVDKVRPSDKVSKMLRDTYTALSLDAISTTMLHTTALAMNEESTADVSVRHLKNLTPMIVELSEIMPIVVEKELAFNNPEVEKTGVGKRSVKATQEAWSREVVK